MSPESSTKGIAVRNPAPMLGFVHGNYLVFVRKEDDCYMIYGGTGYFDDAFVRISMHARNTDGQELATVEVSGNIKVEVDGVVIKHLGDISTSNDLHTIKIRRRHRDVVRLQFFFGWDYPIQLRDCLTSIPRLRIAC
ncbi:hypothetical protein KJ673_01765 [Patescibacteria group bacterium]|nr:hypothetical protein [Patescibacteria group bacterium]MCG2687404.1 hypothetical protein [Candidatus Parcubacteria bacterium]